MNNEKSVLINLSNCNIENKKSVLIKNISWQMQTGESWLVLGSNKSGKDIFLQALSGKKNILPEKSEELSLYSNVFNDSVEIVSLERAASLIEEERNLDESEYIEGGVDIGRTGRVFICEDFPELKDKIETYPQIKLCGVEKILDRGLKYMSTGEIRRTLLAKALLSGKELLILSDPFAGLDVESRKILLDFFETLTNKNINEKEIKSVFPRIILSMERFVEIPSSITNVLEFDNYNISFCGTKTEYEKIYKERSFKKNENREQAKKDFQEQLNSLRKETDVVTETQQIEQDNVPLVEMNNVNVGWNSSLVLKNLSWVLNKNQHWLIRGPNGCGKTTFLELITGDNMQVFCNDIKIFGKKRGSGETIWDIKKNLGIVSYRLHVEYRMLGGTTLRNVIISGFYDSIGLYEEPTDIEIKMAEKWLCLAGFNSRYTESFGNLSYGEQRAILILRAAVKCPKILILDEPCHGLDEDYRQKILDLIETIAESGTTTILHVTHEESEVLECEKNILEFVPNSEPMYKIIKL